MVFFKILNMSWVCCQGGIGIISLSHISKEDWTIGLYQYIKLWTDCNAKKKVKFKSRSHE